MIVPKLELLDKEHIELIHEASTDICEKLGVRMDMQKTLDLFRDAGADVNPKTGTVKIPKDLISEAIKGLPKEFTLYSREKRKNVKLGLNERPCLTTFGLGTKVVEYDGTSRASLIKDIVDSARLCDALDQIDVYTNTVSPSDVNQELIDHYLFYLSANNTAKHIFADTMSSEIASDILKMAAIILGDEDKVSKNPIFSSFFSCTSPLRFRTESISTALTLARRNIPLVVFSMVLGGATGPATPLGTVILHHAEFLAGATLIHLVNERCPVLYGSSSTMMQLRDGTTPTGGPESMLINLMIAQIARYFKVPSFISCWSDSKLPDAQAAHEKTLTMLPITLAGANILFGAGCLNAGLTLSLESIVIDCEIWESILKVLNGIDISSRELAENIDTIFKVGIGGSYLGQKHTLKHMYDVITTKIFDRVDEEKWRSRGGKNVTQVAHEYVRKILEEHKPEYLSQDQKRDIETIINERRKIKHET